VPMESLPPPSSNEPLFAPLPPGATLSDPDAIVGASPRDTDPDSKPITEPSAASLELPSDTSVDMPPILAADDPDLLVPVEEPGEPIPTGPLAMVGEHRVAVHTRAGRVRRGIVRDVDLAAATFKLHPQSGGGYETVKAEEIKAVFFMLSAGERPPHANGRRVKVMFADGRSMAGARDGEEGLAGFFFIPDDAARTNTRRVFVSRAAANDIIDA
ncbi:MAG: hypothetical protein JST92_12325, partial [Deltaproteobacteria bacterium]|nr:hypothetical protein [Deltaproteobacteria bacterium]